MEAAQDTISPSQDQDVAAAATPLRYVVIVGEHSDDGSAACRIEDPASLIVQMLAAFAAASERSRRVSTSRDQR